MNSKPFLYDNKKYIDFVRNLHRGSTYLTINGHIYMNFCTYRSSHDASSMFQVSEKYFKLNIYPDCSGQVFENFNIYHRHSL